MAGFGNIMNRSNPGERYLMGDLMGPDARFVDDMNLLESAVKLHVLENPNNPFLKEKADHFRTFRANLGWHDCYVIPNDTFAKALQRYHDVAAAVATSARESEVGGRFSSDVGGRFSSDVGGRWSGVDVGDESTLSSIGNWVKGTASSLVNRSMPGTLYNLGDFLGPDKRFSEDLAAIDDTVRTHARPMIAKYPHSQSLVNDYEQWRQGLGWWELDFKPNDTMNTAKAKLAAIKSAQGEGLRATDVAAPGEFVAAPLDTTTPVNKMKTFGKVVAGVAGVVLIVLGFRAVKRGAGRVVVDSIKSAGSSIASGAKSISTKLLPGKTS